MTQFELGKCLETVVTRVRLAKLDELKLWKMMAFWSFLEPLRILGGQNSCRVYWLAVALKRNRRRLNDRKKRKRECKLQEQKYKKQKVRGHPQRDHLKITLVMVKSRL